MISLYLIISAIGVSLILIAYAYYKIRKTAKQEVELKTLKNTLKEVKNVKKITENIKLDGASVARDGLREFARDK